MKSHLELEYKMMLTKEQYLHFLEIFPDTYPIDQLNVYYDSYSMPLHDYGMGMRIRDKEGKHLFTLKKKQTQGHQEYECYCLKNDLEALNEEKIQAILNQFNLCGPYFESGRLQTSRTTIALCYGELCLDKDEYYGTIDYEVEYELYDHVDKETAQKEFFTLLDKFNLAYVPSKYSKIQRCYLAKEEK